ncbi:MAG: cytidine deaminase [Planctomycetota bacterium]|nr:cytidine deaminase [Planctomycetota bacterium]
MSPIETRLARAQQLPNWQLSASAVSCLCAILQNHTSRIPSDEVRGLLAAEAVSLKTLMQQLMLVAQQFATAPVSDFLVGAAALGETGDIHLGANYEFEALPLNCSVHAEQACLSNALLSGETQLRSIALSAAPCGHCRQFLHEQREATSMTCVLPGNETLLLPELLPQAFGPKQLDVDTFLFEAEDNSYTLSHPPADSDLAQMSKLGLPLLPLSHAPYSQSPAAAVVRTVDGVCHRGVYLENAAFNPSLPAFQSALAQMQMTNSRECGLSHALLLELEQPTISHAQTSREAWRTLSNGVLYQAGVRIE